MQQSTSAFSVILAVPIAPSVGFGGVREIPFLPELGQDKKALDIAVGEPPLSTMITFLYRHSLQKCVGTLCLYNKYCGTAPRPHGGTLLMSSRRG